MNQDFSTHPLESEVAGLYPANVVDSSGTYSPETEQVFVAPPGRDGYCDVWMFDNDGDVVDARNRGLHRIRGALDGDGGYDISVSEH